MLHRVPQRARQCTRVALAGFVGMLVDFAHRYGAQARADHRRFVDLFRNGRLPGP
ncbi:hypothetical protein ACFMQL_23190 [Nonomuraea fastidiosa]|uniref:hypothetical protein n=1 Tax=Nonomuraea TaxID=83681 RepID=UPI003253C697